MEWESNSVLKKSLFEENAANYWILGWANWLPAIFRDANAHFFKRCRAIRFAEGLPGKTDWEP